MKFAPYRDGRKAAGSDLVGSDGSFQSQVTWSLSLFANKWCSALKQVDGGPFTMCVKYVMCWLCATAVDTVPNQTTQCVHVFPCDLEIIQKEPECLWLGRSLRVCVRKAVFSQVSASLGLSKKQKQNLTANWISVVWFFSPENCHQLHHVCSQQEDWWQVTVGGLQKTTVWSSGRRKGKKIRRQRHHWGLHVLNDRLAVFCLGPSVISTQIGKLWEQRTETQEGELKTSDIQPD